jgi:hypothetical protein
LVTVTFLEPFLDEQILYSALMNVTKNRDPVSGQPIWNPDGLDPVGEASLKLMKFLSREAVSPRIALDTANAIYAGQAPSTTDDYNPLQLFMKGVYPFRSRDVDLSASYNRYLYEGQKKRASIAQDKNAVSSRKPITDEDVRRNYQSTFNKTVRLNEELLRVTHSFESMGLTGGDLFKAQKNTKIGERKSRLLRMGLMERPVPSPDWRERLLREPWGAHRLKVYEDEIRKHDRIVRLD